MAKPLTQEWSFAAVTVPPLSSPNSHNSNQHAAASSVLGSDGGLSSPFRVPSGRPNSGDSHKRPSSAEAKRSVERKTSAGGTSLPTTPQLTASTSSSSISAINGVAPLTTSASGAVAIGAMVRSPSRDNAPPPAPSSGTATSGVVSTPLSARDRSQSIDSARARTPERIRTPHVQPTREEPIVSPQYDSKLNAALKAYVFLGGSCDPTTWRRDVAVPLLERAKVPYYNPQIRDWHPGLIQAEAKAKEECSVLIFVIDGQTRAIASMLEATEHIFRKKEIVLVIEDVPETQIIEGESVGRRQQEDLNRARAFLCDIAARHQDNCDVFPSVEKAVLDVIYNYQSKHGLRRGSVSSTSSPSHPVPIGVGHTPSSHASVSATSSALYTHTVHPPSLSLQTKRGSLTSNPGNNGPFSPLSPASPLIVLNHPPIGVSPASSSYGSGSMTPLSATSGGSGGTTPGATAGMPPPHSRTPSGTTHNGNIRPT